SGRRACSPRPYGGGPTSGARWVRGSPPSTTIAPCPPDAAGTRSKRLKPTASSRSSKLPFLSTGHPETFAACCSPTDTLALRFGGLSLELHGTSGVAVIARHRGRFARHSERGLARLCRTTPPGLSRAPPLLRRPLVSPATPALAAARMVTA